MAVLPGVWRWADASGGDRCGTALATPDGLVVVDPPALSEAAAQALLHAAGPVHHVVLTSPRLVPLARPFAGATVWAPATTAAPPTAGVDRPFGLAESLPGGLAVCQLPETGDISAGGASDEVALFWPAAGDGLLLTGDSLPFVGQVPVFREGAGRSVVAFADLLRTLLAMEPGTLAPGHQAPPQSAVARSTGYAAHIGSPYHRRRAAPVAGPRFLVPQAGRVLQEAFAAPVVLRRAAGEETWLADPFACTRCGRTATPAVQTCGGPLIPRLCPDCRANARTDPPRLRLMACAGGCCTRAGARAVLSAMRQAIVDQGAAGEVEVVPVSCLGECSIGPLVGVATAAGAEPAEATTFREARLPRLRQFAADEDEELDEASERVLSRFTALVQPAEAATLVRDLVPDSAGDGVIGDEGGSPSRRA